MLGLPEKKVRKVVQILSFAGHLHRLCDDGTIWWYDEEQKEWFCCLGVPQGDE
jgi:hypothetical protein